MFVLTALVVLLVALTPTHVGARQAAPPLPRVYVEDATAALEDAIAVMPFERVSSPEAADAIILNGALEDGSSMRALAERGATVVLVLGPGVGAGELSALLGGAAALDARIDPTSARAVARSDHPCLANIQWNSAPQVRERLSVAGGALDPLVTSFESGELLLGSAAAGAGVIYVITPVLAGDANRPVASGPISTT